MKRWLAAAFLLALTGALWLYFSAAEDYEDLFPDTVLALIAVSDVPDWQTLKESPLGEWAQLEGEEGLAGQIPPEKLEAYSDLFRENLTGLWVGLHLLERKENGALRPHFTAVLAPRRGRLQSVEQWLSTQVLDVFGQNASVERAGEARLFRGPEPGQILYVIRRQKVLVVSNSEAAWSETLAQWAGGANSLADDPGYRQVRSRLPSAPDLLVYFRGSRLLPFLPEFGYAVRWVDGEAFDNYYSPGPPAEAEAPPES
ncbi:MAG TPA: hypothetical protein VMN76_06485 [Acidobacteriota bacterium]|nr:hypothetical protein [Acidobacteriota bacterium]